MTLVDYDHFQVMGTITGKFHQNPLKTVGGVAETRLCLRTDGRMDEPKTVVPFDLRRETIKVVTAQKMDFGTKTDNSRGVTMGNYMLRTIMYYTPSGQE